MYINGIKDKLIVMYSYKRITHRKEKTELFYILRTYIEQQYIKQLFYILRKVNLRHYIEQESKRVDSHEFMKLTEKHHLSMFIESEQ